jgi:hypothetical protein
MRDQLRDQRRDRDFKNKLYIKDFEVAEKSFLGTENDKGRFELVLSCIVTLGNRPAAGQSVTYFVGAIEMMPTETDEKGIALANVPVITKSPILLIRVKAGEQYPIWIKRTIPLPWPEKEKKAKPKRETKIERAKAELELAKIKKEMENLTKPPETKKETEVEKAKTVFELAKIKKETEELTKPPEPKKETEIEKIKADLEFAKAKKELQNAKEKKPKPQVSKIVQIGTPAVIGNTLIFMLVRIDESGKGIAGKILYNKADEIIKSDTDENGIAKITFPFGEVKRTVAFFLPEKPNEKIEMEIPAVKKEVAKTEQPKKTTPIKPLREKIIEAYHKGRKCKQRRIKK